LPAFLKETPAAPLSREDVEAGLRLTWHFLRRDLLQPRGLDALSQSREVFVREAWRNRSPA
jgi:hypothetical protein